MASAFGFDLGKLRAPVDVVHHFLGKWVAWGVVGLHVLAALYHHRVRKDDVLTRMLPQGRRRGQLTPVKRGPNGQKSAADSYIISSRNLFGRYRCEERHEPPVLSRW